MKFHSALIVENYMTRTDIRYLHEMINDGVMREVDILVVEYNCNFCDNDPMIRVNVWLHEVDYYLVGQIENDFMFDTANKYETKVKLIYIEKSTLRNKTIVEIANFLFENELTAKYVFDYKHEFNRLNKFYE
jgi:hypothetical protein